MCDEWLEMWHYRRFSSENKFLIKLSRTDTSYQLEVLDIKFRCWKETPTLRELEIRCQGLEGIELDPPQLITVLERVLLTGDDGNIEIAQISDEVLELHVSKMVLRIDYTVKLSSIAVSDSQREWEVENFLPLFALYASKLSPVTSQYSSDGPDIDPPTKPTPELKTFDIFDDPSARQQYGDIAAKLKAQKAVEAITDQTVPSHISECPSSDESSSSLPSKKKSPDKSLIKKQEKERREEFKRKQTPNPIPAKKKRKFL